MKSSDCTVIINNIKLPINASKEEAFSVAKRLLSRAGITLQGLELSIYRRSVDARRRDNICFVYSVAASGISSDALIDERIRRAGFSRLDGEDLSVTEGCDVLSAPPVVVGAGPCGLFAALLLAERGYAPVVIERGSSVAERRKAVEHFNKFHILDTDSNIQFGAGGAGTFSDGKLVTRINDPLTSYVLERFVDFGAQEEIRYIAKPHVGTDVLCRVVDNMINRIVSLGGRIEYRTKLLGFDSYGGRIGKVITDKGSIDAGAVVLAIGHSARDTYEELISHGVLIEPKPFSVGMRIEHLAADIDAAMYGDEAGNPVLGHAEYNLSYDTKNRGVYTFCMCPGGEVVAAASESGGVVVNGMSYSKRDGKNSNSAVVCSVFKEDYGATPMSAIAFQRSIEQAAFAAGGGEYRAPTVTVGDFLSGKATSEPHRIMPTYMGGSNLKVANPSEYLPEFVTGAIRCALVDFDKKIKGFAAHDAVLTGAETRTSAPVRILRNNETKLAVGYDNLYPAGEGAGYAGGISSAAIDGLRCAMEIIKRYKPITD